MTGFHPGGAVAGLAGWDPTATMRATINLPVAFGGSWLVRVVAGCPTKAVTSSTTRDFAGGGGVVGAGWVVGGVVGFAWPCFSVQPDSSKPATATAATHA